MCFRSVSWERAQPEDLEHIYEWYISPEIHEEDPPDISELDPQHFYGAIPVHQSQSLRSDSDSFRIHHYVWRQDGNHEKDNMTARALVAHIGFRTTYTDPLQSHVLLFIVYFSVHPSYRGKGVGAVLLRWFVQNCDLVQAVEPTAQECHNGPVCSKGECLHPSSQHGRVSNTSHHNHEVKSDPSPHRILLGSQAIEIKGDVKSVLKMETKCGTTAWKSLVISLHVRENNTVATQCYKRVGFVVRKRFRTQQQHKSFPDKPSKKLSRTMFDMIYHVQPTVSRKTRDQNSGKQQGRL